MIEMAKEEGHSRGVLWSTQKHPKEDFLTLRRKDSQQTRCSEGVLLCKLPVGITVQLYGHEGGVHAVCWRQANLERAEPSGAHPLIRTPRR
jgi:hypothetical protein